MGSLGGNARTDQHSEYTRALGSHQAAQPGSDLLSAASVAIDGSKFEAAGYIVHLYYKGPADMDFLYPREYFFPCWAARALSFGNIIRQEKSHEPTVYSNSHRDSPWRHCAFARVPCGTF